MLRRSLLIAAVTLVTCGASARAEDAVPVLDTTGFWRAHYTLKLPVVRKGDKVEKMSLELWRNRAKWIEYDTPLPPDDWAKPDFDDHSWHRSPGVLVATTQRGTDRRSAYMALLCMRGKFHVKDPAAAKGLKLSVEYRGGVVVYLNGTELVRGHLPKTGRRLPFNVLAQSTLPLETGSRKLSDIPVPAKLLRQGTNVLAVEAHRAAYREKELVWRLDTWARHVEIVRASCGIERIRLSAPKASIGAVVPNVTRPKGLQVWNSNPLAADFDMDWGDPTEPLRPIRLTGALGGTFSGKVVVGSTEPIQGITATMSDLVRVKGAGVIPASATEIRYALPLGGEMGANERYLAAVSRFDVLEETPPTEVPVRTKKPVIRSYWTGRGNSRKRVTESVSLTSEGVEPVFGAVVPVWVTVNVPKSANAGDYTGTLTVAARGEKPVHVGVELKLADWTLPDPQTWHTFVELIQSPETLALGYEVPMWSDEHFKLIERSLSYLGRVGNKTVYVPLICETNQGNAETMVRWIRQPDGTYRHDFSVMDRYLDLVAKHQGKPTVVCMVVWDYFLSRDTKAGSRWGMPDYTGDGPEVTLLDPATGAVTKLELPEYKDPKCVALWQPVADGIFARMKKRGWEDAFALGFLQDLVPTKADTVAFQKLFPDVPWVVCRHGELSLKAFPHFGKFKYVTLVWLPEAHYEDPSLRRGYGWKAPQLRTHFYRAVRDSFCMTRYRLMGESCIMRHGCRGFARMGGDCFPVLKAKRRDQYVLAGALPARYPKSAWHNLNIITSLLARGEKGAVATARFEMMREGLQECEARIFLEKALTDRDLRAKLDDQLAELCQTTLDERTRTIRRGMSTYAESGSYVQHALWADGWAFVPALVGNAWYTGCADWQGSSEKLYLLAGLVADNLNHK